MNDKNTKQDRFASSIISQTHIIQVSRFINFSGSWSQEYFGKESLFNILPYPAYNEPLNVDKNFIKNFLDLNLLVDNIILNKKLLTLDAHLLTENRDDEFRQLLLRNGVLGQISIDGYSSGVEDTILKWLIDTRDVGESESLDYKSAEEKIINYLTAIMEQQNFKLPDDYGKTHKYPSGKFRESIQNNLYTIDIAKFYSYADSWYLALTTQNLIGLQDESLESLRRCIRNLLAHSGSGTYEAGISLLRTLAYWAIANEKNIQFSSDIFRLPLVLAISNEVSSKIPHQLYGMVADSFLTRVEDLMEEFPIEVPVPPFLAILLSRINNPSEIPTYLLEMRDEFRELRDGLWALELERRDANSINDFRKLNQKAISLFKAASKSYEYPEHKILWRALGTLPLLLMNPTSLGSSLGEISKFSSDTIKDISTNDIRFWWRTRPLTPLMKIVKYVDKLKNYDKLVSKVFGYHFNDTDLDVLKKYLHIIYSVNQNSAYMGK